MSNVGCHECHGSNIEPENKKMDAACTLRFAGMPIEHT